jgi:hypothetical protein
MFRKEVELVEKVGQDVGGEISGEEICLTQWVAEPSTSDKHET